MITHVDGEASRLPAPDQPDTSSRSTALRRPQRSSRSMPGPGDCSRGPGSDAAAHVPALGGGSRFATRVWTRPGKQDQSATLEVGGTNAYGWLRSERGVHRLVRISPFDASMRHTSFALIEVMPEASSDVEVNWTPTTCASTSTSSGHGGLNAEGRDMREHHIPTGLVVTCQNERCSRATGVRDAVLRRAFKGVGKRRRSRRRSGRARRDGLGNQVRVTSTPTRWS
jgi:hypothetical protein